MLASAAIFAPGRLTTAKKIAFICNGKAPETIGKDKEEKEFSICRTCGRRKLSTNVGVALYSR